MLRFNLNVIRLAGFLALPFVILQLAGCATTTPLTAAAQEGNVTLTSTLLTQGAGVDERNLGKWNATPLYWSLVHCQFESARLLIKKGADVNSKDSYGGAPLHAALSCRNVQPSFIEDLIQKGADVHYKNPDNGWTGLHYASSSGWVALAKVLMDKGADVNAVDRKGTTPLMLAVQNNSLPVAKLLLERGANVHVQDKNRKKAISYAKGIFSKKKEILQLLQSAENSSPASETAASYDASQN